MSLRAGSVPAHVRGTDATRLGPDLVVLDVEGKVLRGLNPTAARVWELIDGALSAQQIAERIAAEFEVPAERALTDVVAFLEVLASKRLVNA